MQQPLHVGNHAGHQNQDPLLGTARTSNLPNNGNARGHRTRKEVGQYTSPSRLQYNVIIKQQPMHSSELDFGIWMSLWSVVEWMHQNARQETDVLTTTVQEAWNDLTC